MKSRKGKCLNLYHSNQNLSNLLNRNSRELRHPRIKHHKIAKGEYLKISCNSPCFSYYMPGPKLSITIWNSSSTGGNIYTLPGEIPCKHDHNTSWNATQLQVNSSIFTKLCTMKGRQTSLENLELKCWQRPEGLVEQERSYQTGCEQVAGSMHSSPKKAGGLKKNWSVDFS